MDCSCPETTALVTIVAEACGFDLKQIQRVGFQRYQATPTFDADNAITDLAVWQELMTATDSTKIVVTPPIGGDPIIEPGEAITSGGNDNSTLNGVEENEGTGPSTFSCVFKSLSPSTEKQMKAIVCEKNLTVYLFLQGGRICAFKVSANVYKGINIQSPFVGDRGNQGFGTKDTNAMSFYLLPGWSEDIDIVKPTWNPLTDL